jgi:hypothetical protein
VNSAPLEQNVKIFLFKLTLEMSQNPIGSLIRYNKKDNPNLSKNLWNWLEQQKESEHFKRTGYTYYNLYVGPEDLSKCERTHLHFKFSDDEKKIVTIRNLTAHDYDAMFDSTQPNNDLVYFKKPTTAEKADETCCFREINGGRITRETFEAIKNAVLNKTPNIGVFRIVKPE